MQGQNQGRAQKVVKETKHQAIKSVTFLKKASKKPLSQTKKPI
jgi:hypothetical protein